MKKQIDLKRLIGILSFMLILIFAIGSNSKVLYAKNIKSIEITKVPDKCAYNVGDGYSTSGMKVVVNFSDGTKEIVDNNEITSFSGVTLTEGRAFTQEGWKEVRLEYKGAKTTYGITVFDPKTDYYITYNTNGGNKIEAQKIDGSTKAFKLPKAKKKGATFLGWYDSKGKKYTKYEQGMGPKITLEARWGYSITFNANGGTGKMNKAVVDDDYTLPKSGFKRSGYKFAGWSTKKAANVITFYPVGEYASYIPDSNKNITLYAQWVKSGSYKITYVSVKGVTIDAKAPKKYTAGKTTMLELAVMKNNYDMMFAGWEITVNNKIVGVSYEIPAFVSGNIKLKPTFHRFEG